MSKARTYAKPAVLLYREAPPYDDDIQRFQNVAQLSGQLIGNRPHNVLVARINLAGTIAERSYLRGDWDVCGEWSRVTTELCVEYLANHWQAGIGEGKDGSMADRAHGFVGLSPWEWQVFLERGLCWAAVAGCWNLVDSLLASSPADIASPEDSDPSRCFYAQLAAWWQHSQRLPAADSIAKLNAPKAAMYGMLAEVACAISTADQTALGDSLSRAIEAFLGDPNSANEWPYAATFMWHLAEQSGIYPAIAASHRKYLMILPEDPAGKHSGRLVRVQAVEPRKDTPADRLNMASGRFREWIRSAIESYETTLGTDSETDTAAWFLLTSADTVAKFSYLLGDVSACHEWSGKAALASMKYLQDEWPLRANQSRIAPNWVTEFEEGIAWAAIGGHWGTVEQLMPFPNSEIKPDLEGRVACEFHQGLARWWKNDCELSWVDEVKKLRGSGSKTYHTLADIVAALSASDSSAIAKSFRRHVEHFCKQRQHEQMFPMVASFLRNVAHQRHIPCELPADIANFLFVLSSEV